MTVYYRKRKSIEPEKPKNELLEKGLAFVKGFLKNKVEEATDVVEEKLRQSWRNR